MKGSTEIVRGRIEEAAGALTGNDRLRARGWTDQAVGHVRQPKESARKIVDKARTIARKAAQKAKRGS